jgi:hypothetical protein
LSGLTGEEPGGGQLRLRGRRPRAASCPDSRLAGLAVAALALALRAPFIVVLLLAGAAGALAHVVTG